MSSEIIQGATDTVSHIDLSLVVSCAALALSVLSPVISSIISGIFRLKEKDKELEAEAKRRKQEFYDQHKVEVIEAYIRAVGKACKLSTPSNFDDFGAEMGEIYLYVDKSQWPLLDTIAKKLDKLNFSNPSEELTQLCKALSDERIRSSPDA